jgi:hypothetical protein
VYSPRLSFVTRFESLDSRVIDEKSHLLDCDLVQLAEAVRLRRLFLDEQGVQVLQVGEAHELGLVRMVSNVAFVAGREST